MPPVATNAAPSTLEDVIGQCRDAFRAEGNPIDFLIGEGHLEGFGVGKPPRVIFIPDKKGKLGPPIEMGGAASMFHGCDVAVRAAESGDDLSRLGAVQRLADLVIAHVSVATTGRVTWEDIGEDSPLKTDAYGADMAFRFTYRRDIRHEAKRWALAAAVVDTSPPFSPTAPHAAHGTEPTTFDVATVPQEPS